jgi:hypothetical protein
MPKCGIGLPTAALDIWPFRAPTAALFATNAAVKKLLFL